jgi:hypothetical protein
MKFVYACVLFSIVLSAPVKDSIHSTRSLDSLVYSASETSLDELPFSKVAKDVIELVGEEDEKKIETDTKIVVDTELNTVGVTDEKVELKNAEEKDLKEKKFFGVGWDQLNGGSHVESVRPMKEIRERKRW